MINIPLKLEVPLLHWRGRTTQNEYVAKRNAQFGFKCASFYVISTFSQSTLALDCENVKCRE